MGFIVNEKRFVAVAITKMAAKKRENTVFGRDLRRQHTVKFAEANKPLEKMGFAIHVPHGFEQRLVVIVCKAAQQRRTFAIKLGNETVYQQLFFGKCGQINAPEKRADIRRDFTKAAVDAACVLSIRCYAADFKKTRLQLLIADNGGGEFFLCYPILLPSAKASPTISPSTR